MMRRPSLPTTYLGFQAELVARESREEVGLAHAGVPDEHHWVTIMGERGGAGQIMAGRSGSRERSDAAKKRHGAAAAEAVIFKLGSPLKR